MFKICFCYYFVFVLETLTVQQYSNQIFEFFFWSSFFWISTERNFNKICKPKHWMEDRYFNL